MSGTVRTVLVSATFREALSLLINHNTNGLVVVDQSNKIRGILSSWDLIQYIVPDYLEEDKHLAPFEAPSTFADRILEVLDDPITNFMTEHVHTVKPETSLMSAATLLSEFRIRQLPVIDEEGTIVGYINRTDIKRAIAYVVEHLGATVNSNINKGNARSNGV